MSQEQHGQDITLPAAADLSSYQYYAMKVDTSGRAALATADVPIAGILQNKPAAAGRGATIRCFGSTKFKAGTGGVTAADVLRTETGGKLVTAISGEHRVMQALETVAADGIGEGLLLPAGSTFSLGQTAYAEIAVSSAELLAINATPKTLVAAPGAGYVTEFCSAMLILDYVSAAYANNGLLGIYETDASGALVSGTTTLASFLGKTADTIVKLNPETEAAPSLVGQEYLENKALVLTQATGESITGDSPIRVKIAYRIHATGL